ncbi:MAG TPA: phosphoenolpyruvate carboxykinase (ATP) [Trueperaceae bacterium]|nr:phosphoenolpyruvate carboxykinase (ATP) [Trueperaceae bacterium]
MNERIPEAGIDERRERFEAAPKEANGLSLDGAKVVKDASTSQLYEHAIRLDEGLLAASGALAVDTGVYTGRSPQDKFVVRNAGSEGVDWGAVNQPLEQAAFDRLLADMQAHLVGRELFVQDLFAGADQRYRLGARIVTEYAWHSLFARNLFITPAQIGSAWTADRTVKPDWVVLDLPSFRADPERHGCASSTIIAVDFERRLVLVGNTEYAGEIKKSIFGVLNLDLPRRSVFPMHCSANEDEHGNTALFFGLSGTGKTTLSADAQRRLIGDDEHGWSDDGIFNFEGGCYAKVVDLSKESEPEIYAASQRFGTVLENVKLDPVTRRVDYTDTSKTENTRAAYPLKFMPNASPDAVGSHPTDVVFLTADAFGVLPPISRLSVEQAMYHFLSGYTAKVAGTERGVTEPAATFSACFGAPFMPLPPSSYAAMLGERLRRHGSRAWLVNTGWTGGACGVGSRIKLGVTRSLVRAALAGKIDDAPLKVDPHFGLAFPTAVPGVDAAVLDPRGTWADKAAYDDAADKLVAMFRENFRSLDTVSLAEVKAAGPS